MQLPGAWQVIDSPAHLCPAAGELSLCSWWVMIWATQMPSSAVPDQQSRKRSTISSAAVLWFTHLTWGNAFSHLGSQCHRSPSYSSQQFMQSRWFKTSGWKHWLQWEADVIPLCPEHLDSIARQMGRQAVGRWGVPTGLKADRYAIHFWFCHLFATWFTLSEPQIPQM